MGRAGGRHHGHDKTTRGVRCPLPVHRGPLARFPCRPHTPEGAGTRNAPQRARERIRRSSPLRASGGDKQAAALPVSRRDGPQTLTEPPGRDSRSDPIRHTGEEGNAALRGSVRVLGASGAAGVVSGQLSLCPRRRPRTADGRRRRAPQDGPDSAGDADSRRTPARPRRSHTGTDGSGRP